MSIQFGIEQEFFILKKGGFIPTNKDLDNLFYTLQNSGWISTENNTSGDCIKVYKFYQGKTIYISNEIYTHILEVILPPLVSINLFQLLYDQIMNEIKTGLNIVGLEIKDSSVLFETIKPVFRASEKSIDNIKFLNNNLCCSSKRYYVDNFVARIVSTQIHLDADISFGYKNLKTLYSFEYLFPLLFTNSTLNFIDSIYCLRPLIIRDNSRCDYFPDSFDILSFGKTIKTPQGAFRPYTFICFRKEFSTIEFRSCDNIMNTTILKEMIVLRKLIYIIAISNVDLQRKDSDEKFYNVCKSGSIDCNTLKQDILLITKYIHFSSRDEMPIILNVINKLKKNLKRYAEES